MHRSIPLVLIVLQAVLAQEDDEHHCPCRYKSQTAEEKTAHPKLISCKILCKPWNKYFPRPTTRLACENSCEHFYKYLADDFEHRMANDQEWAHPSCTAQYVAARLGTLPQASIPKNAAVAGCKESSFLFARCIQTHLDHIKQGKKPSALRGSTLEGEEDTDKAENARHASKLAQLKNWKQ